MHECARTVFFGGGGGGGGGGRAAVYSPLVEPRQQHQR